MLDTRLLIQHGVRKGIISDIPAFLSHKMKIMIMLYLYNSKHFQLVLTENETKCFRYASEGNNLI